MGFSWPRQRETGPWGGLGSALPPPGFVSGTLLHLRDLILASVVFVFFFKDSAEILMPTAFSRPDHILPPTEGLLQEVPRVSHRNMPPETSKAWVSRDPPWVSDAPFVSHPHSFHSSQRTPLLPNALIWP